MDMDYNISAEASIDQLDAMLRDNAEAFHKTAHKPTSEWSEEDWNIIRIALHASAARAFYLILKESNEENT